MPYGRAGHGLHHLVEYDLGHTMQSVAPSFSHRRVMRKRLYGNFTWIERLRQSLTLRIMSTSVLIFVCYFIIGLQLAMVPAFVHLDLGYSPVLAGLAISAQYLATLATPVI